MVITVRNYSSPFILSTDPTPIEIKGETSVGFSESRLEVCNNLCVSEIE